MPPPGHRLLGVSPTARGGTAHDTVHTPDRTRSRARPEAHAPLSTCQGPGLGGRKRRSSRAARGRLSIRSLVAAVARWRPPLSAICPSGARPAPQAQHLGPQQHDSTPCCYCQDARPGAAEPCSAHRRRSPRPARQGRDRHPALTAPSTSRMVADAIPLVKSPEATWLIHPRRYRPFAPGASPVSC